METEVIQDISEHLNKRFTGMVKKKGNTHGLWHKRFLSLEKDFLTISRDANFQDIEMVIKILNSMTIEEVKNETHHRFKILETPDSVPILLTCDSSSDCQMWIEKLNKAKYSQYYLSMDKYNIVCVLGKGFYGKVQLCMNKEDGSYYAIKSIQKGRFNDDVKSDIVQIEKDVMVKVSHPFITKIFFSFQTEQKFYLGLEYVPGGDLCYLLQNKHAFTPNDIRIYAAEISLALMHIHSLNIIYRDLKPENIMFDERGHIKLTDFGLSKIINAESGYTTTFCGTSEYLAPEIVINKSYSYKIDEWALGIVIYEMVFGQLPFYSECIHHLYTQILRKVVEFPPDTDPDLADYLSKLLTKDPDQRPSFEELKSHPYFQSLDWDKVYNKEYELDYVPVIDDITKPNTFDPEFTTQLPIDSYAHNFVDNNIDGFSYVDTSLMTN